MTLPGGVQPLTPAPRLPHHLYGVCSFKHVPVANDRHTAGDSSHQVRHSTPVTGRAVLLVGVARMQHQACRTLLSSDAASLETENSHTDTQCE